MELQVSLLVRLRVEIIKIMQHMIQVKVSLLVRLRVEMFCHMMESHMKTVSLLVRLRVEMMNIKRKVLRNLMSASS